MLRSRQNLEIGEWATITVSRNSETQESRLSVNKETPIRSIENGNMHALELKTHLFIGGYDSHKVKISRQVDVETNFKGCIKMVKVVYCIFSTKKTHRLFRWIVVFAFCDLSVLHCISSKCPEWTWTWSVRPSIPPTSRTVLPPVATHVRITIVKTILTATRRPKNMNTRATVRTDSGKFNSTATVVAFYSPVSGVGRTILKS